MKNHAILESFNPRVIVPKILGKCSTERQEQEAQTLASLTRWDINDIHKKMNIEKESKKDDLKWWQEIWKG